MSSDRETTRIVRLWLEEGANVLPDRVLDDVLDRLPATPQRQPRWSARRNLVMSLKIALAGTAVVVLGVLGIVIYFGQLVGPGLPRPTPSATPSATSVASQPPSPFASQLPGGTLMAGRYTIRPEPFSAQSPRVLVTVPAGYQAIGSGENAWAIVKVGDEPTDFSGLGLWEVDHVYEDACRWSRTEIAIGPTVDDFVAALMAQSGRIYRLPMQYAPEPVDVVVDGYSGKQLYLSVWRNAYSGNLDPSFPEFAFEDGAFINCDEGEYRSWPGRSHQAPGQQDDVRVLDVNGTRLIIVTTYFPYETSLEDHAELDAMFESIDIQAP